MKSLPPETISGVFLYSSKLDLKNLRLVCKTFDVAGVPLLFDEVYITARYAALERASKVASRFRPFIKTLVYSAQHFRPDPNQFYHPSDEDSATDTTDSDEPEVPHLTEHNAIWDKLRQEEEEIGGISSHLCQHLSHLSNLQTVVLTDRHRKTTLPWCQQAFVDGHRQEFHPWTPGDIFDGQDTYPTSRCDCPTANPDSAMATKNTIVWQVLLNALYISGNPKIKALVAESTYRLRGLTVSAVCTSPRQSFHVVTVFSRLTSIRLVLGLRDLDVRLEDEVLNQCVVAKTLASAVNMEYLEITMEYQQWREKLPSPTDFQVILSGCVFPKLCSLKLRRFTFTEAEMTSFLSCSPILRTLSLDYLNINDGTWGTLLNTIKESSCLDSIHLRNPTAMFSHTHEEWPLSLCTQITRLASGEDDAFDFNPGLNDFFFGNGLNPLSPETLQEIAQSRGPFETLPATPVLAPTFVPVMTYQDSAIIAPSLDSKDDDRVALGGSIFGPFLPE